MEYRQPKVFIACGRRATGKTIETIDTLFQYVNGNPNKGISGRKALIFDVNDEFGRFKFKDDKYYSVKTLRIKDIAKYTMQPMPELRRIRPYWDDGKRMTIGDMGSALGMILENYKDGALLVEDINKYTSDNMKMDLIGSLATIRQAGIDLIAHYQMIGKAGNPKILGMTNYIRMHKTNDSVKRHANKFQDKVTILSIAENIVEKRYQWGMDKNINNNTGKFFSLYVDLEFDKIRGIFTQKEAESAIQEYISIEHATTITPLLKKRDRLGNPIFKTYEQSYAYLEGKLMKDYFTF